MSQSVVLPNNLSAKQFVKLTSSVPSGFIDELFEFYDEKTRQTDFVIRLDIVAKWLSTRKRKLVETLKKSYLVNVDYISKKNTDIQTKKDPRANNNKLYLLTPDCFKRLAMLSHSKNADMIRTYFIEIENLFLKYRDQTIAGMQMEIERLQRNQRSKKSSNTSKPREGYIYIIRASEAKDGLVKIGRTNNIVSRLRNYNTGQADDVELLYTYKTNDIVTTEACVKSLLVKHKYRKYKEVYQANLDIIKELVVGCEKLGAKVQYKLEKSIMTGGYYIVIDKN
jgi:phage anti-repressor protein